MNQSVQQNRPNNGNNNSNSATATTATESRQFSVAGQNFESPEAFLAFHNETAAIATGMRMEKHTESLPQEARELITEIERVADSRLGRARQKVAEVVDSEVSVKDILIGAGAVAAAAAVVFGGYRLWENQFGGASTAGLLDGGCGGISLGN